MIAINTAGRGFTEAGLATCEPDTWLEFLSECGHWQLFWSGRTPPEILRSWGVREDAEVREWLLARPGHETGFIRVFDVSGLCPEGSTPCIRAAASSWDTGGIFDLDLRVRELLPFQPGLKSRGWRGISWQPVDWKFGELDVREWLVTGQDGVVLALIERLAPPLATPAVPAGFGPVFNSSQIVRDMDASVGFYSALGFRLVVNHSGPLASRGGEVLGIPPDRVASTPVRLAIMHPGGEFNGSVELVSFEDAGEEFQGRDLSAQALPWHRGLNLLRFPAGNLELLLKHLATKGIQPAGDVAKTRLEPWGQVLVVPVTSPDGAWLEFYQPDPGWSTGGNSGENSGENSGGLG